MTTNPVARATISVAAVLALGGALAACGSESTEPEAAAAADEAASSDTQPGVRVVDVDTAAATYANPPEGLVVLDVRTPEEFAEARIDGATLVDFYADDFAEQIAELDRDVPYLLYCRSGNRSSQAAQLMADLGFTDVSDVGGGIISWQAGGQPLVAD